MSEFIDRRLRSGQTLRYHTVPHVGNGQTVAEHAWRATVLLHTLWPQYATRDAVLYMLYHDSAEQELGDIPAPTKWKNERLHEEYDNLEREHLHIHLELDFSLSVDQLNCCKMADMLELVEHTASRIIRGDHSFEVRNIYWNGRRHLISRFGKLHLFPPAQSYLGHLHDRVAAVCPSAVNSVG